MSERSNIVKRLHRVEGQVRGITKMVEDDRYCIDVIHQLQAARAALGRVEEAVLHQHAQTCVAAAIKSGDEGEEQEKIAELLKLISRSR